MNNKGFTLVELLATISLLAVLTLIAVPNIIGVVNRNKNKTYVEDAKKLISLAEYRVISDSSSKPSDGESYCFSMQTLGSGDFDTTAPNGGKYSTLSSYVKVTKKNNELEYRVVLVENKDNKNIGILREKISSDLYKDNIANLVSSGDYDICSGTEK